MELWELVRRMLMDAAGKGKTFQPGLVTTTYYHELLKSGVAVHQSYAEFAELGEAVAHDLEAEKLIRHAGIPNGGAAILGAMERTEAGERLLEMLCRRGMIEAFEGMQVDLDAGAIGRMIHQFNS